VRTRSLAWFMTAVAVAMIVVSGARLSRGGPAGPKTYAFLVATVVVIVIAIFAWRKVNTDTRPERR
jgi:hypothetical protein